uniref:Uncharacterized protein n=1 Tax=Arundo donax TaxID=35708 RepID=A0A0A8ZGB2_ARUDO
MYHEYSEFYDNLIFSMCEMCARFRQHLIEAIYMPFSLFELQGSFLKCCVYSRSFF